MTGRVRPPVGTNPAARNVLLVVDSLGCGGAERHVVEVGAELRARGHGVTIACSVDGHFAADARAAGIVVVPTCARLAKRRLSAEFAAGVRRLVTTGQFDIVHAHLYAAGLAAASATVGTGVPLVLTEQTEAPWRRRHQRVASRWTYARAEQVIGVSRAIERQLTGAFALPREKVHFIPNGVPVRAPAEARPARRGGRIGLVARLQPEKDVATFLRAASVVAAELPEAQFVVAGDGPLRAELEQLAGALGIEGRVRFLGFRDDAREVIRALDVFVLSSLSEGTPLTIAEAMAAGVPVVATSAGGIPDQITHGRDGLLVPPRDPRGLAEAVCRVARDRDLAHELSASAQARAAAEFGLQPMVDRIEAVYVRALRWRVAPAGSRRPQPEPAGSAALP